LTLVGIFGPVAERDRSLKFVRAAYAWLGAYRHACTVGFISMMILGISSRVAPILAGIRSAELDALWAWNLWRVMDRGRAEEKQCEMPQPRLVRLGA